MKTYRVRIVKCEESRIVACKEVFIQNASKRKALEEVLNDNEKHQKYSIDIIIHLNK